MALFLAVDAGGTKTEFLLADEDRELARSRTGTIKRMRTDAGTAESNLDAGLAELTRLAGVSLGRLTRTCVGAAGWTVPTVAEWMRAAFAQRLPGETILVGDVEIALDAAFRGGPGVLVLAGTGSNVAGRSLTGQITTVGGWGPVLADQGSGHRIGYQALRAIFLAIDERRTTSLLSLILEHWQLADTKDLIDFVHRAPGPDISQLARLVARAAEDGDAVARSVLEQEAAELAHLADLMLRRVYRDDAPSSPAATPQLAFAGSIMEHIAPVRSAIERRIEALWPGVSITAGVVDPLQGALWRARLPPGELPRTTLSPSL